MTKIKKSNDLDIDYENPNSDNRSIQEPIQVHLDKLGEDLQKELDLMDPNDERLLNLALSVLLLMFRKASRTDSVNCQDLFIDIKHQGKRIRGTIDDWKLIVPSLGQGFLSIGAGVVGFSPLAGHAFKAVSIVPANGVVFNLLVKAGDASGPLNFLGQGTGAFKDVLTGYNQGKKTVYEIDLDKMKNQLNDRTQSATEKTNKCAEIARKIQEILNQNYSMFQVVSGATAG